MAEKKPKANSWDTIETPSTLAVLLHQAAHHPDLEGCEISLMWMLGQRANKDGRIKKTRVISCPEVHTVHHGFDRIIGINKIWWESATPEARAFELDLALCRICPVWDADGDQRLDENDRPVWRTVPPDFEGFEGPIKRHGAQAKELESAGSVLAAVQTTLPFAAVPPDVETAPN